MYLAKYLQEGLKILALDKKTIRKTAREKDLEEIFLATLFLNYVIVLIVYFISLISGGITVEDKIINQNVLYAFLMIYPLIFNLIVFILYGFFGYISELVESKNHIRPLMSVGYHVAIVYSLILYIIFLSTILDLAYGAVLMAGFGFYFIYALFVILKTVYKFSGNQVGIIIFFPLAAIGLLLTLILMMYPDLVNTIPYNLMFE